jgi:hypothetical protein
MEDDRPIRRRLKAVHDDDLVMFLRSLGLSPISGLTCKFCKRALDAAEVAAVFPQSGAVKVTCAEAGCLQALQELIEDGTVQL